ncbi:hypothetical protein COY90_03620 [Candidatus Roizmanbacteria bacterium CG_4_10_14_0_8_um_filter_39_9]|uniref:Bacterial Ig-like domain-containing protein n=1 Tax=Candidatus Roizmanbacteria bacterium CG_4_10_14_0_8_um_filter_39_9 TaxID=1974829 RepID=A0A2M7QCA5_9BACT|nr:MAG: hypothetical protein COY90_03620 [Candidatus Roizmanbacteria bacterium CG_4_10_14_0_8_um_filter_39_9]
MKYILALVLTAAALVFTTFVYAEEFAITKIGALTVNGKYYKQFWYEPTKLTLEGTGSRGANIDIFVDSDITTIKADINDGKWKYTHPVELEKKDHNIKVGSGEKIYSFILTIGVASVPLEALTKGGILPEAGVIIPLLILAGIAGTLIFFGFRHDNKET